MYIERKTNWNPLNRAPLASNIHKWTIWRNKHQISEAKQLLAYKSKHIAVHSNFLMKGGIFPFYWIHQWKFNRNLKKPLINIIVPLFHTRTNFVWIVFKSLWCSSISIFRHLRLTFFVYWMTFYVLCKFDCRLYRSTYAFHVKFVIGFGTSPSDRVYGNDLSRI